MILTKDKKKQLMNEISDYMKDYLSSCDFGRELDSYYLKYKGYHCNVFFYNSLEHGTYSSSYSLDDCIEAATHLIDDYIALKVDGSRKDFIAQSKIAYERINSIKARYDKTIPEENEEKSKNEQNKITKDLTKELSDLRSKVDNLTTSLTQLTSAVDPHQDQPNPQQNRGFFSCCIPSRR